MKMDDNRLTKQVFNYDYNICINNWSNDVKQILVKLGISDHFESKTVMNLSQAKTLINDNYSIKWSQNMLNMPKLRTYRIFKTDFKCEDYVRLNLTKYERSLLCQFRCGILPLRIETGRYIGEPVESRTCRFCDSSAIEDEKHFLLDCGLYSNIRNSVFSDIISDRDYTQLGNDDRLSHLLNIYPRKCAKFIVKAYICRRTVMYS